MANSRKHILQSPNFLIYPCLLPHLKHLLIFLLGYFGAFFAFASCDVFAIFVAGNWVARLFASCILTRRALWATGSLLKNPRFLIFSYTGKPNVSPTPFQIYFILGWCSWWFSARAHCFSNITPNCSIVSFCSLPSNWQSFNMTSPPPRTYIFQSFNINHDLPS